MIYNALLTLSVLGLASAAPSLPRQASAGLSLTQKLTIADSSVDRFNLIPNDADFVFKFVDKIAPGGKGGDLVAANRKTFPALVGTGSGMAVGFLDACGFNTPHIHNRATELQIVTSGKVITEMLPENGVLRDGKRRVIRNELTKFQMQPFYQGSVHTQYNPDCAPATFIASFNNEDFGTGQIPDELFALNNDLVSAAFGESFSGAEVDKFQGAIPQSIALGIKECVKRCYKEDGVTLKDPKGNNDPKSYAQAY